MIKKIIDAWNNRADEYNQWDNLSTDEKVEFAYKQALSDMLIVVEEVLRDEGVIE